MPDTESVDALLPVQDDSSRLVFDPDPPGGILGLLAAIAVHSLGGAVWEFPPLEPGRVDFFLSIAEHDDFVSIPVGQKHSDRWCRTEADAVSVEELGVSDTTMSPRFPQSLLREEDETSQGTSREGI